MAVTKQKKQEILKDLETNLKKAKVVVFVNFHGLSVSVVTKLRKMLKEIGVKYVVAKKTLIKKALGVINPEGVLPELEGEIAIALSEGDPISSTKTLEKFAKENKAIKLLGGVFEDKYIGPESVIMLANIPSREILLGKLVYVINSPVQGMVGVLSGITKNLVSVLNQIHERKI